MASQRERMEMLRRFISECELLSRLHHPCIVQFLGVYLEKGSQLPVMVMEYLSTTLAECLDKYGVLPEEITYGILQDVALGLRYLHEHLPPIVHRDLSANNVLLATDMSAKISDHGMATIFNLSPAQITQRITTQVPGTPCYMPPEALISKPSYTSKIDSYSYGVLMIHVLCGEWPFPGNAFIEHHRSFLPVSEFERHREHLLKIGLAHPLMGMIRQCLSNVPVSRPEASEILRQIKDLKSSLPSLFENKLEIMQQIQLQGEGTDRKHHLNQRPSSNNADKSKLRQIIASQREENEAQRTLIEILKTETEAHRSEIMAKKREVEYLRQQSESQIREIKTQQDKIKAMTREVVSQSEEILSLRKQLEKLSVTLPSLTTIEHLPPQVFTISADMSVKWTRCADLPVPMQQLRPGGLSRPEDFLVFQYDPRRDRWDTLAPCPVRVFTLGQFQGRLIALGGLTNQNIVSNKVYQYREDSRKWEEYLKPMPTPRYGLSVITTESAIIACAGGIDQRKEFSTVHVEVYSAETGQWYPAEPEPHPNGEMTYVIINDACYFLGGGNESDNKTPIVLQVQVSSLIESGISHQGRFARAFKKSVWKTLPGTPLFFSTVASIGGQLLTVGGFDSMGQESVAIRMFVSANKPWVRMPLGNLPVAMSLAAAIEIPGNKLLVCGGRKSGEKSKETYVTK